MFKIYKRTYVQSVRYNGTPQTFDLMARIASEEKPSKAILLGVFETYREVIGAWDLYKLLYKFIKRRRIGFDGDYWVATTLELVTDVDLFGDLFPSDIDEGFFTWDQFYPEQDPAELDNIAHEY